MEIVEVVEAGLLTTVQDLGRFGYQRYGVPVSGAMDPYALRLVNTLLGNQEDAAALEITLVGPKLKFLADTCIAMGGADLAPRLSGQATPTWCVLKVDAGSLLTFDGPTAGLRAYVAVVGGFDVPVVMGSRSTYIRAALGGHEGRVLKPGDRLSALPDAHSVPPIGTRLPQQLTLAHGRKHQLRVIMGPQDDLFEQQGIETFLGSSYTVSRQSDRVGYRLEGEAIKHLRGADIVSDGIPFGAVQVTGDGQPVILMADRGSTGGYTKIATVISSDLGRVSQSMPGVELTFNAVTLEEAHEALREQEKGLHDLRGLVEESRQKGPLRPRVTINGEAFEVSTQEGGPLTQVETLDGQSVTARRTVTATVDGQAYTFEVEVQEPR